MNNMIDEIIKSRILFIDGKIDQELSNEIIMKLLYLDALSHDDIQLYINSPGGELSSGLAIIDVMNSIKSNVNTVCIGSCYSMAAIILACGNKGKRAILKNSEVMIHEVGVTHIEGKTKKIMLEAERIRIKNEAIIDILANNTSIKKKELKKIILTDYYMDANIAVEKGFVDFII